jgi:hypothetical protein
LSTGLPKAESAWLQDLGQNMVAHRSSFKHRSAQRMHSPVVCSTHSCIRCICECTRSSPAPHLAADPLLIVSLPPFLTHRSLYPPLPHAVRSPR